MIIDTHCHFDLMPNPEDYISKEERLGNIVIGMTNAPQHFEVGMNHVKNFKRIRLSLGFHPQLSDKIYNQLTQFKRNVDKTSYIGEIGLDFSKEYVAIKSRQIECLDYILSVLKGKNKIISVHSRHAEDELISLLDKHDTRNVIFHWYTGKLSLVPHIIERGYYFSINESMTISANGRKIIERIPQDRILTETDAPFNRCSNIIAAIRNMGISEDVIQNNFRCLLNKIREA